MKNVVNLSQRTDKNLSPYWEIGWATNNLLNELDHGDFTRLVFTFFKTCLWWMNNLFFSDIPKSSVKFPKTQSLWSLAQAYPSIKHWWSIIFATLPFTERAEPILLDTRTRYTVATNWYTFTHHLFLVINFARKAGIDNTSYDATGSL